MFASFYVAQSQYQFWQFGILPIRDLEQSGTTSIGTSTLCIQNIFLCAWLLIMRMLVITFVVSYNAGFCI